MESSSGSTSAEQSFLPPLTTKNRARTKHKKKVSLKKKKNGEDIFVSLPEVAKTIKVVKRASKAFANKSSSSLENLCQTQNLPTHTTTKHDAKDSTNALKSRRRKLRLPPLVLTPSSQRMASEERWSAALGLRDSYEIPMGVFNKLMDDIVQIDQQMKEEEMMNRIREKRVKYAADRKREMSFAQKNELGRTPLPGFSYFPGLVRTNGLDSNEFPKLDDIRANSRLFRQEQLTRRKMSQFKDRHSHVRPT